MPPPWSKLAICPVCAWATGEYNSESPDGGGNGVSKATPELWLEIARRVAELSGRTEEEEEEEEEVLEEDDVFGD